MSALINKSNIEMVMSEGNKANIRMFDKSVESRTNSSIDREEYHYGNSQAVTRHYTNSQTDKKRPKPFDPPTDNFR